MKWIILIGLIATGVTEIHAQYFDKYYGITYDVNLPLSNKEYVGKLSFRGAKFSYRELINEKFSIGGDIGFATYEDYVPPTVYSSGNQAIWTDIYSYVYSYSGALAGDYLFTTEGKLMPYAGLGLGASYNMITAYYNVYGDQEKKWGLLLRPQGGVLLRFGTKTSWGATAGLHLDYSTTKSPNYDYKNFTNLGFQIGLVYLNW